MEFLTVITTVYALAKGISDWLDERAEKDATVKKISTIVFQIRNVLHPLHSMRAVDHVERPLFDSVASVGDTLKRTQEHLLVWEYKRSRKVIAFFSPSIVTKELEEDERQLNQQLIILLTSIAVVGYVDRRQRQNAPLVVGPAPQPASSTTGGVLGTIRNAEVREFWRGYMGDQVSLIPSDDFRTRLSMWLGMELSPAAWLTLDFRLDEFGIGGVTPSNLDHLVGSGSFREAILEFIKEGTARSDYTVIRSKQGSVTHVPRLPLLLWVDDHPHNNDYEVAHALKLGINVVQLTSTPLAKAWIESNEEFLRRNASPATIRVISDDFRQEPTVSTFLNISAGENILRYLRGHGYRIPVLIYTGSSLRQTTYVKNYEMAAVDLYDVTGEDKIAFKWKYGAMETTLVFSLRLGSGFLYQFSNPVNSDSDGSTIAFLATQSVDASLGLGCL
ncbi:hypothetical protein Hypma_003160 [Hypsizygus marmoreus]|uniref:Uncharacterized protein n=1 Tax=Hypsizygus marmoreus TaxID=39966 RepID=A0A369K9Q5_HYPMA|nr:hypothetical protein Hypma_003160 [Hypsizygus marmoreus]